MKSKIGFYCSSCWKFSHIFLLELHGGGRWWQPTVNRNNHDGVKFRSQIIETILNALNAAIHSTTLLPRILSVATPRIHDNDFGSSVSAFFSCILWPLRCNRNHLNRTDIRFTIHSHSFLLVCCSKSVCAFFFRMFLVRCIHNVIIGISEPLSSFLLWIRIKIIGARLSIGFIILLNLSTHSTNLANNYSLCTDKCTLLSDFVCLLCEVFCSCIAMCHFIFGGHQVDWD